ncbi:MAG: DUF4126 domain-containing protein [Acidobacteriota bacterium]|nr:DUF4126 domain-containing protein [Acidobacteriota bacterium]
MNLTQILGLAMGSAWTSGINLYATVAVLGLLERFGFTHLPGELKVLGNTWIIGVALALYAVEFFADKVPYLDTVWDAVHTFIRIPAGAVLAYGATAQLDPAVRVIALLAGGGLALSTHGTKASVRAVANLSPEPFTNWILSFAEDAIAIVAAFLTVLHPLVILCVIVVFVALTIWLAPKIFRRIRRLLSKAADILRGRRAEQHAR